MANKIIHKHSSVITDGKAKLPTASQLEYGELAINYAEGVETISMKNSANQIVEIKSTSNLEKIIIDNELITAAALTELDERIKEFENINTVIEENELVTAAALTELDERIEEIDSRFSNTISETNEKVSKNELVTAHALTNLDYRIINIENAGYVHESDFTELESRVTAIEEGSGGGSGGGSGNDHTHGTIILSGDVTGSATISGTNAVNIIATVADNSHAHTSDNITDSISDLSGITSSASGLVQGKAVQAYAASKNELNTLITEIENNEYVTALGLNRLESRITAIEEGSGGGSGNNHTHGTIILSGDVTGSGTIGSGTTEINITATVADNSHAHTSDNISDSISIADNITSSATELVQGKAVQAYAAPKTHAHTSDNITDSISASSGITSSASGLVQGKAVQAYAAPKTHNHGTITLSGDVTGSGTIGSGTTEINITATVADNSHAHTSDNITDSISDLSGITSSATELVQGKAVQAYAASKNELNTLIAEIEDNEYVTSLALNRLESRITVIEKGSGNNHTHGTITLSGDVTGSGTIGSGTTEINITATVADNSHTHISANISDSISDSSGITSSASGLVQGKAVYGMVSTIETNLNDRINTLVTGIEDNEYITAWAVTELESRVVQLEQTIAALQETLANVTAQLANTLTVE